MTQRDALDRTIFNAIPIPAFVVDSDVRILELNRAAAQFCGQESKAVYESRAGQVLHCLHSSDVPEGCGRSRLCRQCVIRNSVRNCLQGRAVSRVRMKMNFLPESDRKTMDLLVSASPLADGNEQLALLIVEDITATDELEQALRRSERLAVAGRHVATIAHEINNPLESLSNFLHLLATEPGLPQNSQNLVEMALQEVKRLSNISRQTLAPHRESKSPVVTKLSELLDDVVATFHHRFESVQIVVRREYTDEGKVSIYPSELRQVFTNLITNAIDAMTKGGELRLSIETSHQNEVIVRISDSGCGIPPENLRAIFEPFFTTKGEKGTGIGLWVIKGIIGKAGGRIEVTSSITGRTGTCFSISLPAISN